MRPVTRRRGSGQYMAHKRPEQGLHFRWENDYWLFWRSGWTDFKSATEMSERLGSSNHKTMQIGWYFRRLRSLIRKRFDLESH